MERNVDKIKRLEHELGRYRKKVADQAKETEKLRRQVADADAGSRELHFAVDSMMAALAERYGEREQDGEEVIGYRFEYSMEAFAEALKTYKVSFRVDNMRRMYVIGVFPKEAAK